MNTERKTSNFGRVVVRVFVLLIIIAIAVFAWLAPWREPAPDEAEEQVPVTVVLPVVHDLERLLTVPGYIESDAVVTIMPKVSGTLLSLTVDVGDYAPAGAVIGGIDPEPYRLAVKQAQAALNGASSTYERAKRLSEAGAASDQSLDQARVQFENASAQYDLAVLNLGYTEIIPTVGGTVVKRHISAGATVSPSVAVVTLSDNSRLYVNANVPEPYYELFESNAGSVQGRAEILAYDGLSIPLLVRTVSPVIETRTKTFSVRAEIDQRTFTDGGRLIPGLRVAVTFVVERRDEIPSLPFSTLSGGDTLWYVDDDGTAQWISFIPGFASEDRFEIPDEYRNVQFIEKGQHFITAGTPVKIIGHSP